MINVKTLCIYFLFLTFSCENRLERGIITVRGNIKNLPNGKIYLKERGERIDSVNTIDGKFAFEIIKEDDFEPKYIQFTHIASIDSTVRVFIFDTKAKYKSKPVSINNIMLEEGFPELVGNLEDSEVYPKFMSSKFRGKLAFGTQSKVYFADTIMSPTTYTVKHLEGMINKYPFSYHVLFEFRRSLPMLGDKQALSFFSRFDIKLRNGHTGKQIENYIKSRSFKKMTETLLPDTNNIQRKILLPSKNIHLVILWASWCGPCRKEIPDLKMIYQKFNNRKSFDMVSISYDEKNENWKKALQDEKMPWRQLIMSKEVNMYSKELFSFDGSIPTSLLVDGNGKIVKKYVGYDKENEKEIRELIASYSDTN